MNGAYRKLIQMPTNIEWNFFEYTDPNEELVPTEASYLRQMNLDTKKKRSDKNMTAIPKSFSTDSKPYQLTNLVGFSHVEAQNIYGPGDGIEGENEVMVSKSQEVQLKGLQLKFTLPSGTYATMLIREITKHSTSAQYQTQLTAAASSSSSSSVVNDVTTIHESNVEGPLKKSRLE